MFTEMPQTRRYQLKERARRQEETRQRITEATVELHAEVGPAATAISEIARRAGVQRLTVYKHFPDDWALLAACSAHGGATHPPPDREPWAAIEDPFNRTRTALRELYYFYAENDGMLGHVTRDAHAMPAVRKALEGGLGQYLEHVAELLAGGWNLRGKRAERLEAQLDLVLRFEGWTELSRRTGGDSRKAADLAADLVRSAA
jgi:AcrR family transcriptional regulator